MCGRNGVVSGFLRGCVNTNMNVQTVREWISKRDVHVRQNELLELARRHPDAARKQLHLATEIKLNKFRNGLVAVLSNGKEESFSFVKCFQTTVPSTRNVVEAFRNTVDYQTHGFRVANGYERQGDAFHVGHVGDFEFKDLMDTFLRTHNLRLEAIGIRKTQLRPGLDYTSYVLSDEHLAAAWQTFHDQKCSLLMQTPTENYAFSKRRKNNTTR
jgi:hypothetical protein